MRVRKLDSSIWKTDGMVSGKKVEKLWFDGKIHGRINGVRYIIPVELLIPETADDRSMLKAILDCINKARQRTAERTVTV